MREILFRGKRKDNGEWVQGNYLHLHQSDDTDLHIIVDKHGIYNPIDPETVGEFTGLMDENDARIFEGDIIRRKRVDGNWYNYEVFWWENCWGIKGGAEVALLILPPCGLQVIGNIYDNPELVGGAST